MGDVDPEGTVLLDDKEEFETSCPSLTHLAEQGRDSKDDDDDDVKDKYIHRRIAKYFDDKLYFGTVKAFYPADTNEDALDLWLVVYEDGDREDLNTSELQKQLDLYARVSRRITPTPRQELQLGMATTTPNLSAAWDHSMVLSPVANLSKKRDASQVQKDENPAKKSKAQQLEDSLDTGVSNSTSASSSSSSVQILSVPRKKETPSSKRTADDSSNTDFSDSTPSSSSTSSSVEDLSVRRKKEAFPSKKTAEDSLNTGFSNSTSSSSPSVEVLSAPRKKEALASKKPAEGSLNTDFSNSTSSSSPSVQILSVKRAPRKREALPSKKAAALASLRKDRQRKLKAESWDEESSVDDNESRVSRRRRRRTTGKTFSTLERAAWLGSDDEFSVSDGDQDTDDGLDADEAFHRYELAETRTARARRSSSFLEDRPPPPPSLSSEAEEDILESIDKEQDKALQRLLLNAGFQFGLLPHQFLAVRMIAGLPADFPMHKGSEVSSNNNDVTMALALQGLDAEENTCTTKGVLIADEMGLGKTVEAIAGAVLRNEMAVAKGEKKRPTMFVSPNDAVMIQWRDTLIANGVTAERIIMFKKAQTQGFNDANFILLTRYTLQAEVKELFDYLDMPPSQRPRTKSALFPHATVDNIHRLKVHYLHKKCKLKERNLFKNEGEHIDDAVTRAINLCTKRMGSTEPVFETFIIDEAHLLKNRCTYWSIGAALVGTHAARRVPLTGTPYNNGPSDLATIMTFVDAAKHSATKRWWDRATSSRATQSIVQAVTTWHETYLVRRRKEDVLKDSLPPKRIKSEIVPQYQAELFVYETYEEKLVDLLKIFERSMLEDSDNPILQAQLKELFTMMMAIMSNMRSANIHAMLPGGREFTKHFSPSRRHLLTEEERSKVCVCCNLSMRPSIPIEEEDKKKVKGRASANTDIELEEGKEYNDDSDEVVDEEENEKLLPLPHSLCAACNGPVNHFAHKKCIDKMKTKGESCPRCLDIKKRMAFCLPDQNVKYCQHIAPVPGFAGGFTGSSKINAVVDWYNSSVPNEDKVLILSFFKGGLDLLEGIFIEELGIDCARFDGDVDRRTAIGELERFKCDPECKILLATVQSGGVGLNIVEANHVAFLDRWYNPFVHNQAEDRCYRIGQKKPVNIVYFDCGATIDEAMVQINLIKKENSAVLLADGFEIGSQQTGSLSYKELSGLLGRLMSAIRCHRSEWLLSDPGNGNLLIPRFDPTKMESLVENITGRITKSGSDEDSSEGSDGKRGSGDVVRDVDGVDDVEMVDLCSDGEDDYDESDDGDDKDEGHGDSQLDSVEADDAASLSDD